MNGPDLSDTLGAFVVFVLFLGLVIVAG